MMARPDPLSADPAVLARYRDVFAAATRRQMRAGGWIGVAIGLMVFAVWWLGIAFDQIGSGLVQLGKMLALMFPPSVGSHFSLLLHAMGETLAIAFLGTLIAAVLAFPLGFLAANNTAPAGALRFLIRRSLDTIRGIDVLIWALVFVGVVGL